MLPRVFRQLNYIKNNQPFFPVIETPEFGVANKWKEPSPHFSTNVKNTWGYSDWKIREMVKKELEKEDALEISKKWSFSGLVGILFFIAFLYERKFI